MGAHKAGGMTKYFELVGATIGTQNIGGGQEIEEGGGVCQKYSELRRGGGRVSYLWQTVGKNSHREGRAYLLTSPSHAGHEQGQKHVPRTRHRWQFITRGITSSRG